MPIVHEQIHLGITVHELTHSYRYPQWKKLKYEKET